MPLSQKENANEKLFSCLVMWISEHERVEIVQDTNTDE